MFFRDALFYIISQKKTIKFTPLKLQLLDLFHKSKNNLFLADYLYQRILNFHA